MKYHFFLSLLLFSFSHGCAPVVDRHQLRVLPGETTAVISYRCGYYEESYIILRQVGFPGDKKDDSFYENIKNAIAKFYPKAECVAWLEKYIAGKACVKIEQQCMWSNCGRDYMLTFQERN